MPTAKESLAVFSGKYGKLIEFDLSKQNNTSKNRIWSLPSYVKSMYVDKIGYLYAADDEDKHSQSLLIFDLNQSNEDLIDWTALSVANDKAMRGYANGSESYTPMLIMERAGIRRALTTPVEGISPAKAAEILDNFGFMVARQSPSDGEAFIRRAIELDPTRTIAYLNLADLIRSRLGDEVEWKEKQRATNEANDLYERYLALGGSRTPEIAAFLLGDLGKDYPNDLCRVIASYAKAGRLAELLSNNPKRIMAGKRLVNLLFTTQGTAHLPAIEAYDAETDERLDDDAIRLPDGADFDSSDGLSLVSYRNVYQILHYTDAAHPISSMTLSGDAACRFDSDTADQ